MGIHGASLEGQVANAPGLSGTGLAISQDAGATSSSIISSLIGDKYVLRNIYGDLRVTESHSKV
jgi:hypothetical protein